MGVKCFSVPTFDCKCDCCGQHEYVEKDYDKIYNGAQAVRSLGWSFGKSGRVLCSKCRRSAWNDKYTKRAKIK